MKRLVWAFAVIVIFMVVEFVGGFISGSLALLADATHMLTDAVALGLAASAHHVSGRPPDLRHPFGYRRAQVVAAFTNGVLLAGLLLLIAIEAVKRAFFTPVEVQATTMLWVAVAGLVANAVAFWVLHSAHTEDLNVRGALLHVVNDLLASVAAIVAAVVIMTTGWMQIDPILSLVVAALIGRSAWKLIREAGHILLQGAPSDIDAGALAEGVKAAAAHVEDVHDVRIWQLTPGQANLTLHARINDARHADSVLAEIKAFIEAKYGISESTVQIEIGRPCPDCDAHEHSGATVIAHAPHRREASAATHSAAVFAAQK